MKTNFPANDLRRGYTDHDLCDYAHHIWIQSGMLCPCSAWLEAKACLEANLPRIEPAGDERESPCPPGNDFKNVRRWSRITSR